MWGWALLNALSVVNCVRAGVLSTVPTLTTEPPTLTALTLAVGPNGVAVVALYCLEAFLLLCGQHARTACSAGSSWVAA